MGARLHNVIAELRLYAGSSEAHSIVPAKRLVLSLKDQAELGFKKGIGSG